jgi:hypothetical protein
MYIHLSVSQTVLACGPLFTWKITTDAHILVDMYIECPDDKQPRLKIYIPELLLASYRPSDRILVRNNALHDLTLI